jgi:hypothetical protein
MSYGMYLGDDAAQVFSYSSSSKGDAGSNITSQWVSKRLDHTDQIPEAMGKKQTIYDVELVYVDKGEAEVTVSISIDGGTNWTDHTKTIGTTDADGKVRSAVYNFNQAGKFFNYKISHTSSDSTFQFIELRPEIEIRGEY